MALEITFENRLFNIIFGAISGSQYDYCNSGLGFIKDIVYETNYKVEKLFDAHIIQIIMNYALVPIYDILCAKIKNQYYCSKCWKTNLSVDCEKCGSECKQGVEGGYCKKCHSRKHFSYRTAKFCLNCCERLIRCPCSDTEEDICNVIDCSSCDRYFCIHTLFQTRSRNIVFCVECRTQVEINMKINRLYFRHDISNFNDFKLEAAKIVRYEQETELGNRLIYAGYDERRLAGDDLVHSCSS